MKSKVAGLSSVLVLLFSVVGLLFVGFAGANPVPSPPILEIFIRSDGTVDPVSVPIQRTGSVYTFTGDLTNATLVVERDNVVIDGAGYKLQGNYYWWDIAITVKNRCNVFIQNIDIRDYVRSIHLEDSSNIIIYNNNMVTATNIYLDSSVGNQIVGNNITMQDGCCMQLEHDSSDNLIVGNMFSDSGVLAYGRPTSLAGVAVDLNGGSNNTFYHNNFVDTARNVLAWIDDEEAYCWDNGEEGNFWNDYNGTDVDGDGIGDTPYPIHDTYPDRYPLMVPFDVSTISVELPEWAIPPDPEEPFPTVPVAAASTTAIVVMSAVLLVYLKKHKR